MTDHSPLVRGIVLSVKQEQDAFDPFSGVDFWAHARRSKSTNSRVRLMLPDGEEKDFYVRNSEVNFEKNDSICSLSEPTESNISVLSDLKGLSRLSFVLNLDEKRDVPRNGESIEGVVIENCGTVLIADSSVHCAKLKRHDGLIVALVSGDLPVKEGTRIRCDQARSGNEYLRVPTCPTLYAPRFRTISEASPK